MNRLEIDDPDIHHEFMQGHFCVSKNEIPFCATVPDAIEHVNKVTKIWGGLKGLTQQPAAMARWFLVAQAEDMVGVRRAS